MQRKVMWGGLLLAAAALAAAPALAQKPGEPHGLPGRPKDAKEAHKEIDEARKEARDVRKDKDASAEDKQAAREKLKKVREEHHSERVAKRKERLDELEKKYGSDFLHKAPVLAERRIHARRMARLGYMLELAKETKKDALVPRIEAARKKEMERHDKRMEKLKSTNGEEAAAPAASASGGAK
jgi:hypothetical protein